MTQQPYYPQAPAAYPPAPPQQYPAQMPQQPQYPGYPQQAYPAPQQAPAQPSAPLATGTIDDYYSQPTVGGGAGLKFSENNIPIIGQSYVFQVSRPIGQGDIQQQTDQQGNGLFFRDGRPKFVMIVPVQLLEPSPNHPDGLAKWYVKGAARDELARAMAEAGAPEGPPEAGAVIRVTLTGTRNSGAGRNPAHVFAIQYARPTGAAPAQTLDNHVAAITPEAQFSNQVAAPVVSTATGVPVVHQQPVPQVAQPAAQPVVQQAAPPVAAPQAQVQQQGAPQPPANLSPEQQELLARLQSQQQG